MIPRSVSSVICAVGIHDYREIGAEHVGDGRPQGPALMHYYECTRCGSHKNRFQELEPHPVSVRYRP